MVTIPSHHKIKYPICQKFKISFSSSKQRFNRFLGINGFQDQLINLRRQGGPMRQARQLPGVLM